MDGLLDFVLVNNVELYFIYFLIYNLVDLHRLFFEEVWN